MSRDFDARDFDHLDNDPRRDDWERPSPRRAGGSGTEDPSRNETVGRHLVSLRYLERRVVPVNKRGRTIEVVPLSREGPKLLDNTRMDRNAQALYSGFVKPREIGHDTALYRVYLTETDRIEKEGGRVRRVILDFELKKSVYSPLAKAVARSGRGNGTRRE